jgi:tetratricopeptide (TPR) repeat protein
MSRVTALWLLLFASGAAAVESKPAGLLPRAEDQLWKATLERDNGVRFQLADEALALADQAATLSPKDPQPQLMRARALQIHDVDRPESCRPGLCEKAVEALLRARALDGGGVYAARIANELGLNYSKLGKYAEALAEYDRALLLIEGERRVDRMDETDRSVLYSNSAETLMAMGRLEEAIARYRLARDASAPPDLAWELAQWGLGLALDRDEQGAAALDAVRRAVEQDPAMANLSDDGVFFEPLGDKFAYLALGHEVKGQITLAREAWRNYLASKPSPRWARRADVHLATLKRMAKTAADGPMTVLVSGVAIDHAWHSRAQLNETLNRHVQDVRVCYGDALQTDARAEGEVMLGLQVNPLGGVMRDGTNVLNSSLPSSVRTALDRCLQLVARNWRFVAAPSSLDRLEPLQLERVLVNITLRPR